MAFRFGWQITGEHEVAPIEATRRAESIGFDIFLASDHVGPGDASLPLLSAVAAGTTTLRVSTFVLNSDMRNPVQLAWEAATLQRHSGGRFNWASVPVTRRTNMPTPASSCMHRLFARLR